MTPRNYLNQKRKHNNYSAPIYDSALTRKGAAANPSRPQWLAKYPEEIELVFFDLETTGGNPGNSEVIEIAAIKEIGGKQVGKFQTLVNPKRTIPKIVRKMTGIDNEMVSNAPVIEDVIDDLLKFIGNSVLVSHGVINDYAFIANYAKILRNIDFKNYYICTHLVVSNFLPNIPTKSLTGVAHYFGFKTPPDAHRAMVDAGITQSVFWKVQKACEKNGFKTIEDLLKIQADQQTLNRLGPGILLQDIERAPTTPGLLHLFNLNRETAYVVATQNIRRSLTKFTELCEEREFNKLLVDLNDFKFERTTHFLDALLKEKRELKRVNLPIDPRKYEERANGFLQILIPQDILDFMQSAPENLPFQIHNQLESKFIIDPDLHGISEGHPLTSEVLTNTSELNPYATNTIDFKKSLKSTIPIRKTRRIVNTLRASKFQVSRQREVPTHINNGMLKEGNGWCFGPFDHPKVTKTQIVDLFTLWPVSDLTIDVKVRMENLFCVVKALTGQLQEDIDALKKQKFSLGTLFISEKRKTIAKKIELLEAVKAQNWQVGRHAIPRTGLAIISNNDLKELDVYTVVRGTVRKHTRLASDRAKQLKSPRFFTRLFHEFYNEVLNPFDTLCFTEETCADLELFAYWLNNRRSEGEWVDFDDLAALYDPSLV